MATSGRWKYLVVTVKATLGETFTGRGVPDHRLQAELDQQGILGWELVEVVKETHGNRLIFKRPM